MPPPREWPVRTMLCPGGVRGRTRWRMWRTRRLYLYCRRREGRGEEGGIEVGEEERGGEGDSTGRGGEERREIGVREEEKGEGEGD
eukprot:757560-Hanusia_phi.AAC.1